VFSLFLAVTPEGETFPVEGADIPCPYDQTAYLMYFSIPSAFQFGFKGVCQSVALYWRCVAGGGPDEVYLASKRCFLYGSAHGSGVELGAARVGNIASGIPGVLTKVRIGEALFQGSGGEIWVTVFPLYDKFDPRTDVRTEVVGKFSTGTL
jgi:hypothetical protein